LCAGRRSRTAFFGNHGLYPSYYLDPGGGRQFGRERRDEIPGIDLKCPLPFRLSATDIPLGDEAASLLSHFS
jgi:hypothetical protein